MPGSRRELARPAHRWASMVVRLSRGGTSSTCTTIMVVDSIRDPCHSLDRNPPGIVDDMSRPFAERRQAMPLFDLPSPHPR
jgi:hypothetical protein